MAAFTSFGSTLKVGATNAGAYPGTDPTTAVGEILSMNLDGISLNTIDVTNMTDRFRKFVPGLIDSGTLSIEVNLDPDDAQQASTIDLLDASAGSTAPVSKAWLVEFGSSSNKGAQLKCVGILTNFSIRGSLDAAVTATFSIKLTGDVNFVDVD